MATIVADGIKWVLSLKLLRQQIFSEKKLMHGKSKVH